MATSLEENLCCSICLNIYSEPVVLSCSHSFCGICLHRSWDERTHRECPLCRRTVSKDPPPNLVLKNVCEAFVQSRAASMDQQEAVSGDVQIQGDHVLEDLREQKKEVTQVLIQLDGRLKALSQTEREVERAERFVKVQAEDTMNLIREQFKKLHESLLKLEAHRLRAVRNEEKQKKSQLRKKMTDVNRQRERVAKTITNIKQKLQLFPEDQPPDSALSRYRALLARARRPLQDEELALGSGALLDQAKHLGNLSFHICRALSSDGTFCPVVLDPNTCTSDLSLSADLRSVSFQPGPRFPLNAERLSSVYWSVLGAEGWSRGLRLWDVDVSRSGSWELGVASRCERLPGVLSELWKVSVSEDQSEACALTGRPAALSPPRAPVVRLVLDMDRGDLSFYALDTGALIHSFRLSSTGGALFPYFSIGDQGLLKLLPQDVQESAATVSPQFESGPELCSD